MQYNSLMHIGFFTYLMEDMVRFYTEVLGGTVKVPQRKVMECAAVSIAFSLCARQWI